MSLADYYLHIENISLDEEDNYRNNILILLRDNIEKDKDIKEAKIPKGILDIFNKLTKDEEENISNTAKQTIQILNQRKKENSDINNNENYNINKENKNEEIKEQTIIETKEKEQIKNENNYINNEIISKPEEKEKEKEKSDNDNNINNNINPEEEKKETEINLNTNNVNNNKNNDDFDVKNALEQIEKLIKSQEIKSEKSENKKESNENNITNKDSLTKEGGV